MQKKEKSPGVRREGWDMQVVAEEASNEQPDDIVRKTLRGNEDKAKADERDLAGSIDSHETPQGREESKKVEGAKKIKCLITNLHRKRRREPAITKP